MKNNIIVLDTETGGLKSDKNPITQVGLSVIEPIHFDEISSFNTFVQPYDDLIIEQAALDASRVTMKQINDGVDVTVLIKKLIAVFKEATGKGRISKPILCGHNLGFDLRFLNYLFSSRNQDLYEYIDTFHYDTQRLFSHLEAQQKGADKLKYNLTNLSERYGIQLSSAHGAMADVKATKQLLIIYLNKSRNAAQDNGNVEDTGTVKRKARERVLLEF
jgi:DNA polymerase III alpha subunit (gram-positive type)